MYRRILLLFLGIHLAGCTHKQLTQSTVQTAGTVMDIQYQIVLKNLAMLSCHPEALPNHIDLADGVVQINDQVGFGNSGGFTALEGTGFGIERFGPDGRRQITEQWGADATTDPERLVELQDLYRVALGYPPLPPPNAITFLRQRQTRRKNAAALPDPSSPASTVVSANAISQASSDNDSSSEDDRRIPIEILLTDVPPPGWFQVGTRKDVPKNAVYVGCYGDRYAWVLPDNLSALSRFTVTVLAVVKYEPGPEGRTKRGLTFTR